MTALAEFYCDWCNSVHVREQPPGHAREMLGDFPTGWWEVPGKGKSPDHPGHCCPSCLTQPEIYEEVARLRAEGLDRLTGQVKAADQETSVEK